MQSIVLVPFPVFIFSLLEGFKTDLAFALKLYFWLDLESFEKGSHENNNKHKLKLIKKYLECTFYC